MRNAKNKKKQGVGLHKTIKKQAKTQIQVHERTL